MWYIVTGSIGLIVGIIIGYGINRQRVANVIGRIDSLKIRVEHQLDILEAAWKDGYIDPQEAKEIKRAIHEIVLEEDLP